MDLCRDKFRKLKLVTVTNLIAYKTVLLIKNMESIRTMKKFIIIIRGGGAITYKPAVQLIIYDCNFSIGIQVWNKPQGRARVQNFPKILSVI